MPSLVSTRNVFALIILAALVVGAIGIIMSLVNADRPSDTRGDTGRTPSQASTNEAA